MQAKVVIFDIGNVLLEWDPDKVYGSLIPDAGARAAFFDEVGLDAMNEEIDLGAPFKETIYAKAEAFPQYRELIQAWHDRWIEMASPLISGSWDILQRLKSDGVPVYALSNFGVESYAYAKTVYADLAKFDREFISGHLQLIKPDPAIYAHVEEETGFAGSDIVFADDRADNIAAARARGWHGHVFTSAQEFEADLRSLGFFAGRGDA